MLWKVVAGNGTAGGCPESDPPGASGKPQRYAVSPGNFGIPQRIAFCRELPDFVNDPDWQEKLVDSGGFIHSHYTTLEFWDDLKD